MDGGKDTYFMSTINTCSNSILRTHTEKIQKGSQCQQIHDIDEACKPRVLAAKGEEPAESHNDCKHESSRESLYQEMSQVLKGKLQGRGQSTGSRMHPGHLTYTKEIEASCTTNPSCDTSSHN